jgi:hypothetical protein
VPDDTFAAMAELTTTQYDALERAIIRGSRISVFRRGTEYVLIPIRLAMTNGREALSTRHPTTGEPMTLYIDDVDTIDVVR